MNEVQKILETERGKRASLAKNYRLGINIMSGNEFITVGLGISNCNGGCCSGGFSTAYY